MGLFYSLLFGGSLPHFFYEIMEQILTSQRGLKQMLFFTTERLLYTPMFQAVSLYSLAILEVWRQSSTTKHPPTDHSYGLIKFSLFVASIFSVRFWQGKSHTAAVANLYALYWPILKANWSYLSLFVFINIKFVPPMVSHVPRSNHHTISFNSIIFFCFVLFIFLVIKNAATRVGGQFDWIRVGHLFGEQTSQVGRETTTRQIDQRIGRAWTNKQLRRHRCLF